MTHRIPLRTLPIVLLSLLFAACGAAPAPEPEPAAPPAEASAAEALIAKSIAYHDPDGRWGEGRVGIRIMESRPNGVERAVEVGIGPGSVMEVTRETEAGAAAFRVEGEAVVSRSIDGDEGVSAELLAEHGLDAERVMWLRNYYLFVWGLPMKLRDPGTIVDPEPVADAFDGKDALRVRVTYDPEVGGDTWYFYFAPDTSRLIGYRFYHDESANDGEYIHLEGEIAGGGLRLPAKRRWFMHQDDRFLGEDEAVSLTVSP